MLYQAYQLQSDLLSPMRLWAQHWGSALWQEGTEGTLARQVAAACDVVSRLRLTHSRPAYGITEVVSQGQAVAVTERVVLRLPFGSLLHFQKSSDRPPGPPVLLTAPLSGHFATLLRETVHTLLQDHDVYITDWLRPRRLHRLRHRLPGLPGTGHACRRRMPALGAGPGGDLHHVRRGP